MTKKTKTDSRRDYRHFPAEPGDIFRVRENQMVSVGSHPRCGPGTLLVVLEAAERDQKTRVFFGSHHYIALIVGTNKVGNVSWYDLQCKQTTKLVTNLRRGRLKKTSAEQPARAVILPACYNETRTEVQQCSSD